MGEIVFVGLGLHDDMGISLRGLNEVKSADTVFAELYTSLLPGFSLERFEKTCGRRVNIVSRTDIEERNAQVILKAAENHKAVLLVPGDPLIATTHVSLRIEAEKRGIKTQIVNGASVLSAVIGLSGLHNYKFGKSVTIPFPNETPSETPYSVISQNKEHGLHTLCLLDIEMENRRFLSIQGALSELLRIEAQRKKLTATEETLVVGVARAGSSDTRVRAGFIKDMLNYDFGGPPYSLIFPGELHFMEAEALTVLAGAPGGVGTISE
ncbi:MAG TPA: diphthine synthase [candidate division Zixibacteria bacterium]|nr:diphthine synthase [candidate division Zixibacteria bacterium]